MTVMELTACFLQRGAGEISLTCPTGAQHAAASSLREWGTQSLVARSCQHPDLCGILECWSDIWPCISKQRAWGGWALYNYENIIKHYFKEIAVILEFDVLFLLPIGTIERYLQHYDTSN